MDGELEARIEDVDGELEGRVEGELVDIRETVLVAVSDDDKTSAEVEESALLLELAAVLTTREEVLVGPGKSNTIVPLELELEAELLT